jgi:hypothetical protein
MSQLEKLVAKFLSQPPEVSFEEVVTLLEAFGYEERPSKKHRVFTKGGRWPIIVPTVKGRRVKQVYVKRIVDILELREWYEQQESS